MTRSDLYEHILGGVFGQALGDAYAMPAYLRPDVTWERYGGWIEEFLPGPSDHPVHHGLAAGQVTDDTQQAFALAHAILEEGGVTVEAAAKALVQWYDSIGGDHTPYIGPSTRRAVQALKSGADPHTTGTRGDTDGGAMRICPVGLINLGNYEQAVLDTVAACTPSHNTDVAISGAAAVAGAIAVALKPGSTLQDILTAGRESAVAGQGHGHPWLGASVPRRIDLALEIVDQPSSPYDRIVDLYDIVGSTLATSEAVPSAFGILALAEGDVMDCARFAAALSGDADTVGAMACAIAGAWHGVEAFPQDILETLETVNTQLDFRGVARGLTSLAEERSK
jgi:ADP-ribosylglycohydrolase